MSRSVEYVKNVLSSSDRLLKAVKMNEHFPCVPYYSELHKKIARNILEKDELNTAAAHLIEAHGVGLRHTAINAEKEKVKKKSSRNSNLPANTGDYIHNNCLNFGKPSPLLSLNCPKEWTVVQITEVWSSSDGMRMLGFGPPPLIFGLPNLLITRISGHSPSCVKILPRPATNLGCGSLLTELNSILEGNRSVNKDFRGNREQYWKLKQEHHDQLKVLVDSLENWWLDYCKCFLVGEPSDPSDINLLNRLLSGAIESIKRGRAMLTSVEEISLRLLLSSYCFLNNQQVVRGLMNIFDVTAKSTLVSELLGYFRKVQGDFQQLKAARRKPVFLILDKVIQQLPWESITSLATTPISRLPSLHFLNFLSQKHFNESCRKSVQHPKIDSRPLSEMIVVNPKHAFYVLNPGQDLPGVQQRLQPILEGIWGKDCGYSGTVPLEEHIKECLMERDLFLYCGHGSGSKYLPNDRLIKLDCKATPILMGCSSGHLSAQGRIVDPTGAAIYYLIAGSPGMIGMLWEVTDVDCDRFTIRLLDLILGVRNQKRNQHKELHCASTKQSKVELPSPPDQLEPEILRAVSASRPVTKNFLTGAAAVAYGLPICALDFDKY